MRIPEARIELGRLAILLTLVVSWPRVSVAGSIWVDALFQTPALQQVRVNKSGTLIAAHVFKPDTHALFVQAVRRARSRPHRGRRGRSNTGGMTTTP